MMARLILVGMVATAVFALPCYTLPPLPVPYESPNRSVSFWYSPSAADLNSTLAVLSAHRSSVTSVMLYCGHGVDNQGQLVGQVSELCYDGQGGGLVPRLACLGIRAEFVLNDLSTNVTAQKIWMANSSNMDALVTIGKQYGVMGWNLDLEPQKVPGSKGDADVYASFCTQLRAKLNAKGMRLTIDVASWSPMLKQFALLGTSVDRMMNMETYNADSMRAWLNGGVVGGFYTSFVAPGVPLSSCGVGLGSWPTATCGIDKHPCWSTTNASGPPRISRILQDGVPEIALFRLFGDQSAATPPDQRWPEAWWWPLLDQYMSGA